MNRSWLRGRRKILQAEGPESAKAVGGVQQVFGAEERQQKGAVGDVAPGPPAAGAAEGHVLRLAGR